MGENIDVSIIIPAYNSECTIVRLIESIIKQEGPSFEVIFIDDGSTDATKENYINITEGDSRFHYYYQENSGQASARNKAVKMAKGKYLCFLDADDDISDNYLAALFNQGESDNADIVLSDFAEINEITNLTIMKSQQIIADNDWMNNIYPTYHSKLWNLEFYRSQNIDQPNIFFEDVATVPFFLCKAKKIVSAEGCCYYYYMNMNSTTHSFKTIDDRMNSLKYLCELFEKKGCFELYKDYIYKFLMQRYAADKCSIDRIIEEKKENYLQNNMYALKTYFGMTPKMLSRNIFLFGSYSAYRSVKYIYLCNIVFRFMATTVESAVGQPIKLLCDQNVVRSNRLRTENVIYDISKRFYYTNPGECLECDFFIFDFLDERFDLGIQDGGIVTLSDAYLEDEEALIPVKIEKIDNRENYWLRSIDNFIKKLKKLSNGKPILMVKMVLAEKYGNKHKRIYFDTIDEIKKVNAVLNRMYDYVTDNYPDIISVSVEEFDDYYSDENFRYGCFPWHLNESVYKKIGERINEYIAQ